MLHRRAVLAVAATLAAAHPGLAQQITGAGATFPAPVYAKWGEAAKAAIGVELNYQAGARTRSSTAPSISAPPMRLWTRPSCVAATCCSSPW